MIQKYYMIDDKVFHHSTGMQIPVVPNQHIRGYFPNGDEQGPVATMIYQDPITREREEGVAVVSDGQDMAGGWKDLWRCDVVFPGDDGGTLWSRLISVR